MERYSIPELTFLEPTNPTGKRINKKQIQMNFFTKTSTFLFLFFFPVLLFAQWSEEEMPAPKAGMNGVATDEKLFFVGGKNNFDVNGIADSVMTYDIASETWEHAKLLTSRYDIAPALNDERLFCAGGLIPMPSSNQFPDIIESDIVEIVDVNSLELLDTAHLSIPRFALSAVAVGTKILFAGGESTDPLFNNGNFIGFESTTFKRVDIYDTATNTWSIDSLSEARADMGHAVWGDKVYFAGGFKGGNTGSEEVSSRVDIYDASTDTWSTAELATARSRIGAVAANGKVYFAGGVHADYSPSAVIDVYDVATESWDELAALSQARGLVKAGATEQNVFFTGGETFGFLPVSSIGISPDNSSVVDIYHIPTDSWDTYEMDETRVHHETLATDNQLFIVGGIHRPMNSMPVINSTMLIFNDMVSSTNESLINQVAVQCYPNPVIDNLIIQKEDAAPLQVALVDVQGKIWMEGNLTQSKTDWDVSELPTGTYFLTTTSVNQERINVVQKIIKK